MDGNSKCAICLEVLKDPRILPCWHGACLNCIKQMRRASNERLVTCHMCREVCSYENVDSLPGPIHCELCKNFVMNPRQFPCCDCLCCTDCIRMSVIDGVVTCPRKCSEILKYSVNQLPQARICPECFKLHNADGHDCGHHFCTECTAKYGIEGTLINNCRLCGMKSDDLIVRRNWERASGFRDRQEVDELLDLLRQLRSPDSQQTVQQCLEKFWKTFLKMLCLWMVELLMICIYGLCVQTWVVAAVTIFALRFDVILCVLTCMVTNAVLSTFSFYYFSHAVLYFVLVGVFSWVIPPRSILIRFFWQLVLVFVMSLFGATIFVHKAMLELAINAMLLISIKDIALPFGLRVSFRLP